MMRRIRRVVVHCSASRPKAAATQTIRDIDAMHRKRGFFGVGYHVFIRLDGTIEKGRHESQAGAHVRGYNHDSLGVCYAGGLDANGKAADTRTDAQKTALEAVLRDWVRRYPTIKDIDGHRDLSPDRDGDGKVEKHEWLKECPCFDVNDWLMEIGLVV